LGLKEFVTTTWNITTRISLFELALGVEARQPMDLTIPKMRGKCHKGNKNAKEMVRKHEEMIIHKSLKVVGKNIKKL
jgi:hypothetical protein